VPEGGEGQARGRLLRVEASTGDTLWTFTTERGGFYDMRPIVEDGRVFAGTREGDAAFFAVDAETGEEIWRNRQGFTFAADHGSDSVYLNTSADVMSISKETGRTLWTTDMPGGSGFGGVQYHEGYVYHPRGGTLVVLDAEEGRIVHQEPSPSGTFWTVHAGPERIFAQTSGHLIAYEPYQP
jgi:outer membrane protein assembly factor BamB